MFINLDLRSSVVIKILENEDKITMMIFLVLLSIPICIIMIHYMNGESTTQLKLVPKTIAKADSGHWGSVNISTHKSGRTYLELSQDERWDHGCIFFHKILIFPWEWFENPYLSPLWIAFMSLLKSLSFPSSGQRFSQKLIFPQ